MKKSNPTYCNCLYFSTAAFARLMTKIADEEFANTGLTSSYAFLLMTVNKQPGIRAQEISEQLQLTPSTITRLIEKLEKKKLLQRHINGRNTEVYPTEKSIQLDKSIKSAWKNLYFRYAELLNESNAKDLTIRISTAAQQLRQGLH